jgi:hypothetical protein
MDDPGDWDWQSSFTTPGSVSITGDTTQELWKVHVAANWVEADPPIPLSVSIDVVCNDVYMGP